MDAGKGSEPAPVKNITMMERKSERELVVTLDASAGPS